MLKFYILYLLFFSQTIILINNYISLFIYLFIKSHHFLKLQTSICVYNLFFFGQVKLHPNLIFVQDLHLF